MTAGIESPKTKWGKKDKKVVCVLCSASSPACSGKNSELEIVRNI